MRRWTHQFSLLCSLFMTRLLYVAAEHTSPEPAWPPLCGAMATSGGKEQRTRALFG